MSQFGNKSVYNSSLKLHKNIHSNLNVILMQYQYHDSRFTERQNVQAKSDLPPVVVPLLMLEPQSKWPQVPADDNSWHYAGVSDYIPFSIALSIP